MQNNYDGLYGKPQVDNHAHTGVDSAQVSYPNLYNRSRYLVFRAFSSSTPVTTGVIGETFPIPFGGNFTFLWAQVDTAGTTGTMTIDVLLNGTSIFIGSGNNRIQIASGETTSQNNTQPNLLITAFNPGDVLTFDVTAIQTTPAMGLIFEMRTNETTP